MRLCKDCKHFNPASMFVGKCKHENNLKDDLVNGGTHYRNSPDYLRSDENMCGREAKWFVLKLRAA